MSNEEDFFGTTEGDVDEAVADANLWHNHDGYHFELIHRAGDDSIFEVVYRKPSGEEFVIAMIDGYEQWDEFLAGLAEHMGYISIGGRAYIYTADGHELPTLKKEAA